jgi:hypothetical protein
MSTPTLTVQVDEGAREKTLARHPLLETWGQKMAAKPRDYGDLMYRESEIIVSTMLRLAREHDIPSVPVHDSLIVPRSMSRLASGCSMNNL